MGKLNEYPSTLRLITKILLIFFLVLILSATISAAELVSIPILKEKKNLYKIEAEIPILINCKSKNIQKNYNQLFRNEIFDFIENTIEMAEESKKEFSETKLSMPEFAAKVDFDLKNKAEILSLKFNYYQYTGGAHGSPFSLTYNIDLNTGKNLKLIDFLQKHKLELKQIEEIIRSEINAEADLYFQADYGFQSLAADQSYYLTGNYLVIYFQPYAIAPYSTGMPEFRIKY